MHLLRIHMTVPVHEVNDQGSSLTQDEQRRNTSSPTRGYAEGSFSPRRSSVNDCSRNADKVASPSHSVQNEGVTSQQDEQRRTTSSPTRGYTEGSFSPRRSSVNNCSRNADKVASEIRASSCTECEGDAAECYPSQTSRVSSSKPNK